MTERIVALLMWIFLVTVPFAVAAEEYRPVSIGPGCQLYTTKFGECKKDDQKKLYCDFTQSISYFNCADGPITDIQGGDCEEEGYRCWTYTDFSYRADSQCGRSWSATASVWLPSCQPVIQNPTLEDVFQSASK